MDAKRGSKRYKQLLAVDLPRLVYTRCGPNLWSCGVPCSMVTPGVGRTKKDAKVDFVEEVECLARAMPIILGRAIHA